MSHLDVIVFSGPTLSPMRVAEALPEASCLGPVQRGDVLRVLHHGPKVICIIDGVFGEAIPVWHKEILWALRQGVRVFGAASMGALRAAELAAYGMVGVGRIFDAYAREELEDEDEVTVVHAGPERDYRPSSEALVDMRATLGDALEQGVVDAGEHDQLVELARGTFYAERSYPLLLARAERAHLSARTLSALAEFLQDDGHRRSLKRQDALDCLALVRREIAGDRAGAPAPGFEFSYTDAFDALLVEETGSAWESADGVEDLPSDRLVEELQLLGPEVFEPLLRQATARALRVAIAASEQPATRAPLELDLVRSTSVQGAEQLQRLLHELDLTPASYRAWMEEEARLRVVEERTQALLQAQFAPLLRALGDYPRVAQRARHKLVTCTASTLPCTGADGLWQAYFEGMLKLDVPDDLDAYAASVGFRDQAELLRAVTRELEYRRLG